MTMELRAFSEIKMDTLKEYLPPPVVEEEEEELAIATAAEPSSSKKDGEGDHERPDDGEVHGQPPPLSMARRGATAAAGVMPAARVGSPGCGPGSPGCGGWRISRSM